MSLSAFISASFPLVDGAYEIPSNENIPVVINVFNSSSQPVSLKTIYLTCPEGAVSLGDVDIKRRGWSYAPANNVIPAATTIETSGSVPIPSGSNDTGSWIIAPFKSGSVYYLGTPPLELGPYYENLGYWGLAYNTNPPYPLGIFPSTNNASLVVPPVLPPVVSGSPPTQQGYALNFTSSVYSYDPNVSQGALFAQLSNYANPPPPSSLANDFTYEWWSYLRSYGVPVAGNATPNNTAGTIWKTFGFPYVEGFGAVIGYLTSGELYIMMKQDVDAILFPPDVGVSSSAVVPLNNWVHQAVVRSGNTITFYINGTGSGGGTRNVAQNPHYCNEAHLFGDNLSIPYFTDEGNSPYEGFIENTCDGYFIQLRMSNYARYTSNFTPPTGSFDAAYNSGGGSVPVTGSQTTQGSASYGALIKPQVDPTTLWPQEADFEFQIGGVIMKGNNADVITATGSYFRVII